jgi:dihydroneopterin aldolase
MDKVFIEGLEIDALIGIYDWERRIRQTLWAAAHPWGAAGARSLPG